MSKGFTEPEWTKKAMYRLVDPYFQLDADDDFMRILILKTPPEFMNHNIFVLDNVLTRY